MKFAHININSYRNKYVALQEILYEKLADVLVIAETKPDNSFPDDQFEVDGYTMYRKDRDANGGGLLLFIRSDIKTRQRADLETSETESICIELNLGKAKWLIMGAYKPPSMKPDTFTFDLQKSLDKMYINFENVILLGDLNFDLTDKTKGRTLRDMCEIFNLRNLVTKPTCYMKDSNPSLVDIILTNKSNMFMKTD